MDPVKNRTGYHAAAIGLGSHADEWGEGQLTATSGRFWRKSLMVVFVAGILLVPPLVTYLVVSQEDPRYEASATVFPETNGNLGLTTSTAGQDPQRELETEARFARLYAVAQAAVSARGGTTGMSPTDLLRNSSVTTDPVADVLTFAVTAGSPEAALNLATRYADAFIAFRSKIEAQALEGIRRRAVAALAVLQARKAKNPALESALRQQALNAAAARDTLPTRYVLAQRPHETTQVAPRALRAALIALLAGAATAIAFFLLRSGFRARLS